MERPEPRELLETSHGRLITTPHMTLFIRGGINRFTGRIEGEFQLLGLRLLVVLNFKADFKELLLCGCNVQTNYSSVRCETDSLTDFVVKISYARPSARYVHERKSHNGPALEASLSCDDGIFAAIVIL